MTSFDIPTYRFGFCEPYKGNIEFCNTVLVASVDYVFVISTLESQDAIAELIENTTTHIVTSSDLYCREQMQRIICNYYLMPCDGRNTELSPTSICPAECLAVQSACPQSWMLMQTQLSKYASCINCSDTAALLHPLPNCCTGVGISLPSTPSGTDAGVLQY